MSTQIRLLLQEQSDLGPHCVKKQMKRFSRRQSKQELSKFSWAYETEVKKSLTGMYEYTDQSVLFFLVLTLCIDMCSSFWFDTINLE